MSRIFEALKLAQSSREGTARQASAVQRLSDYSDRRRSPRWAFDVAVYVYGHGAGKDPFHEEVHTLNVNANGALLLLSVPVEKGHRLLLTNQLTDQDQDCRVVYLGTRHSRTVEAGVAFTRANLDFWQIHSPNEDDSAA